MVRITNNDAGTNDTALVLNVQDGESPLRVNRDTPVANLNSDQVDGFHVGWADWVTMGWLQVALWCAVALIVVIVVGPAHLSRKHNKQTPTPAEGAMPAPRVA